MRLLLWAAVRGVGKLTARGTVRFTITETAGRGFTSILADLLLTFLL